MEAHYLLGHMTYNVVRGQVHGILGKVASPECRAFTAHTGGETAMAGARCSLPDRLEHLCKCHLPPPSDVMQLGDWRLFGIPIDVEGTSRHGARYVHCLVGGSARRNELSGRWLLGGSER